MNLEWLKKHPKAAAAAIIGALLVFYLLFRNSSASSGGGLTGAIASQNQGQEQMAQLNAQLSAQSEQTQASLAAQENATQAQEQEQQTQLVGQLAGTLIPQQLQSNIYEQELAAQAHEQANLLPLEITAQQQIGKGGSLEGTGADELALLLGEPSAATYPVKGQTVSPPNPLLAGLGTAIGSLGSIGPGLFGL